MTSVAASKVTEPEEVPIVTAASPVEISSAAELPPPAPATSVSTYALLAASVLPLTVSIPIILPVPDKLIVPPPQFIFPPDVTSPPATISSLVVNLPP